MSVGILLPKRYSQGSTPGFFEKNGDPSLKNCQFQTIISISLLISLLFSFILNANAHGEILGEIPIADKIETAE